MNATCGWAIAAPPSILALLLSALAFSRFNNAPSIASRMKTTRGCPCSSSASIRANMSASMSPPLELLPPRPVADRTRPASANQKNFGQIVSPPLTDIQGPAAKAEPPCLGGVTRTPPRHANGVGGNGRVVGLGATNGPLHCVAGIHRHCLVRRSFGRAVANLHSWEPMTREPNSLSGDGAALLHYHTNTDACERDAAHAADSVVLAISVEKDGNLRVVYARIGRCQGRPEFSLADGRALVPSPKREWPKN